MNVQFSGMPIPSLTFNSDRQLQFSVPSGSVTGPGLYPITVTNIASGSANGSMAAVNMAVQPSAAPTSNGTVPVGTSPSSVAIDTATGVAVVTNSNSNDITLIQLSNTPGANGSATDAISLHGIAWRRFRALLVASRPLPYRSLSITSVTWLSLQIAAAQTSRSWISAYLG